MIYVFVKLYDAVKTTLIKLKKSNLLLNIDVQLLRETISALEPIKVGSDSLSADDSNLLACETVIKFVLEELQVQNTDISRILFEAIQNRIVQRRNKSLVSLMYYLKAEKAKPENGLDYVSKKECRSVAGKLFARLFPVQEEPPTQVDETSPPQPTTVKERLVARLTKQKSDPPLTPFMKDLEVFEKTNVMSERIQNLYKALLTIKPTSVTNERVFSSSGLFVSNLRTRLSDKSVNVLIFNKYFFLNEKVCK